MIRCLYKPTGRLQRLERLYQSQNSFLQSFVSPNHVIRFINVQGIENNAPSIYAIKIARKICLRLFLTMFSIHVVLFSIGIFCGKVIEFRLIWTVQIAFPVWWSIYTNGMLYTYTSKYSTIYISVRFKIARER